MQRNRIISGRRSRHATSTRAISKPRSSDPCRNRGSRARRRSRIPRTSPAIGRCIGRAVSGRAKAPHRRGPSGRIAIADAGRSKRKPKPSNGAERSAPFPFRPRLRVIDPPGQNGIAESWR